MAESSQRSADNMEKETDLNIKAEDSQDSQMALAASCVCKRRNEQALSVSAGSDSTAKDCEPQQKRNIQQNTSNKSKSVSSSDTKTELVVNGVHVSKLEASSIHEPRTGRNKGTSDIQTKGSKCELNECSSVLQTEVRGTNKRRDKESAKDLQSELVYTDTTANTSKQNSKARRDRREIIEHEQISDASSIACNEMVERSTVLGQVEHKESMSLSTVQEMVQANELNNKGAGDSSLNQSEQRHITDKVMPTTQPDDLDQSRTIPANRTSQRGIDTSSTQMTGTVRHSFLNQGEFPTSGRPVSGNAIQVQTGSNQSTTDNRPGIKSAVLQKNNLVKNSTGKPDDYVNARSYDPQLFERSTPQRYTPVQQENSPDNAGKEKSSCVTSVSRLPTYNTEISLSRAQQAREDVRYRARNTATDGNGPFQAASSSESTVRGNRAGVGDSGGGSGGDGGGGGLEGVWRRTYNLLTLSFSIRGQTEMVNETTLPLNDTDIERFQRFFAISNFSFLHFDRRHNIFYFRVGQQSFSEAEEKILVMKDRLKALCYARFCGERLGTDEIRTPDDLVCSFGWRMINGDRNNLPSTWMVV